MACIKVDLSDIEGRGRLSDDRELNKGWAIGVVEYALSRHFMPWAVLIAGVEIAIPPREGAARHMHSNAVAWEKDIAGRPQIDLAAADAVGILADPENPVAEIERAPVWMDVAQPHDPICRRRRADGVQHNSHAACDFQLFIEGLGSENANVLPRLDPRLILGTRGKGAHHDGLTADRRNRIGGVVQELSRAFIGSGLGGGQRAVCTKVMTLDFGALQRPIVLVTPCVAAHHEKADLRTRGVRRVNPVQDAGGTTRAGSH